jgi:hypothetical protein
MSILISRADVRPFSRCPSRRLSVWRRIAYADKLLRCSPAARKPVCGMIGADVRPDWSPHVNKSREP